MSGKKLLFFCFLFTPANISKFKSRPQCYTKTKPWYAQVPFKELVKSNPPCHTTIPNPVWNWVNYVLWFISQAQCLAEFHWYTYYLAPAEQRYISEILLPAGRTSAKFHYLLRLIFGNDHFNELKGLYTEITFFSTLSHTACDKLSCKIKLLKRQFWH